ncbi:putative large subunit ribosomal protein LP2 [Paratrimastix pyriformis]|uniref:Large subunit ribosomal protein LP2 n=1 Tax=Paratrimastix pyriformis TaxID=342808 RepID=A0ABQ8UFR8_9EUKA|nr:putative large subunit ribosomal protein LP2 [Paratrimastix pyriformis]
MMLGLNLEEIKEINERRPTQRTLVYRHELVPEIIHAHPRPCSTVTASFFRSFARHHYLFDFFLMISLFISSSEMKHIAAYLLAVLGGNANPTKENVISILQAGGVQADQAKLDQLFTELHGKSIDTILAEGRKKMASVSVAAPAAAPAAATKSEAPKKEEKKGKKEEPKKEEPVEEDGPMLSLFD